MGVPSNSVATTVNPVLPDQLNTYVQMCDTIDSLRQFIGVENQTVEILGTAAPGDGGQGVFYWNPTGTIPDDNGVTAVVPSGSSVGNGEWIRVIGNSVVGPGTSIVNDIVVFENTSGSLIGDSGISLASQAQKLFLATPAVGAGVPVFRLIAATDLPSISGAELVGTTTNDNAAAGNVGEFITNSAADSSVSMTSTIPITITSVNLTAGDWDIWGTVRFVPAGSTTVSEVLQGMNTTTNVFPTGFLDYTALQIPSAAGKALVMPTPTIRASLAGPTTYYLIAQSTFAVSTLAAGGVLNARRRR